MGGICVKPSSSSPWDRRSSSKLSESRVARREESFRVKNRGEVQTGSIDKRVNSSSRRVRDDCYEKKREGSGVVFDTSLSIRSMPKGIEGEQVVAGWPSWLVEVAGEAINGWFPRRADTFEKLDKIGQGTYSNVYKARDLLSNKIVALKRVRFDNKDAESVSWLVEVAGEAINGWLPRRADTFEKLDKIGQGTYSNVYKARDLLSNKIVALKRVRFDNKDAESVIFMAREILILRRLDHPNIIKLEGLITSRTSCSLYLVFEYMEHDLTGLVTLPGIKFTEPQVKCYMKQLLSGLDHCHSNGILHRDIKGSNLLIDNNGILKIADFGLANFYDSRQIAPLTSRVVTLWYRPPELLLGATRYGVAVDLWSAGCILGELYAGKPIMPGRTEVEQLHRIFKLCGSPSNDYWTKSKLPHSTVFKPAQPYKRCIVEAFKDFPPAAIGLMESLLAIDPGQRGTAALALKSEFFTTEPHACDPATLPQYPPSKEIDAKMRDDEAKRQRAAGSKGPKETRAVPAPDANAELVTSIQKRRERASSQSRSELFSRRNGDTASDFSIEQPTIPNGSKDVTKGVKRSPPMRASYSGPLVAGTQSGKKNVPSQPVKYQVGKLSESTEEFIRARKQDQRYLDLSQNMAGPCRIGSGRATNKEQIMDGQGYKGNNKIHFSGPLVSSNMDQMLKDHDRHIQEAARRARLEKTRLSEVQAEGAQGACIIKEIKFVEPYHIKGDQLRYSCDSVALIV
ncbi:serine/threonine/dual specificity protein kinase, catalytic domain-containing protein [Artemisia annua]|uniref:Serine/threonine/dual specificity protein kinase, catalytic domain-containing protein n=1 Tax=Artemisia annua TaxID=35608 RepID=A0A2U1NUE2_ARTAN|nr:serine/threonine/dual specificity protein kinase, catalytic domain-containing protein [Artemisia annua]